MFRIFTREKSFADPWIGSPALNRAGLHSFRVQFAHLARHARRRLSRYIEGEISQALEVNGVAILPKFLPQDSFEEVKNEARQLMEVANKLVPRATGQKTGFQAKIDRPFGFDRYDGGTLNRFIPVSADTTPATFRALPDARLEEAARAITGNAWKPKKWWLYETLQAGNAGPADLQQDLHRDTFFADLKCWYFLEDVREDDGPFAYVVGSHKPTKSRLAWENAQARALSQAPEGHAKGGSLRCAEGALGDLELPAPTAYPVAANTLVIANTFGFHKRMPGRSGARRLSVYGHLRPKPFAFWS